MKKITLARLHYSCNGQIKIQSTTREGHAFQATQHNSRKEVLTGVMIAVKREDPNKT